MNSLLFHYYEAVIVLPIHLKDNYRLDKSTVLEEITTKLTNKTFQIFFPNNSLPKKKCEKLFNFNFIYIFCI
jgi:hypothetical protein